MKIKKGFELRDVCGEKVVIATGIENIDFGHMIALNEVSAFLFSKMMEGEQTMESLVAAVDEEYHIESKEIVQRDITNFYEKMRALGIAQ